MDDMTMCNVKRGCTSQNIDCIYGACDGPADNYNPQTRTSILDDFAKP